MKLCKFYKVKRIIMLLSFSLILTACEKSESTKDLKTPNLPGHMELGSKLTKEKLTSLCDDSVEELDDFICEIKSREDDFKTEIKVEKGRLKALLYTFNSKNNDKHFNSFSQSLGINMDDFVRVPASHMYQIIEDKVVAVIESIPFPDPLNLNETISNQQASRLIFKIMKKSDAENTWLLPDPDFTAMNLRVDYPDGPQLLGLKINQELAGRSYFSFECFTAQSIDVTRCSNSEVYFDDFIEDYVAYTSFFLLDKKRVVLIKKVSRNLPSDENLKKLLEKYGELHQWQETAFSQEVMLVDSYYLVTDEGHLVTITRSSGLSEEFTIEIVEAGLSLISEKIRSYTSTNTEQ